MVCAGSMATQKSKSEGKEMCEDYPCCGHDQQYNPCDGSYTPGPTDPGDMQDNWYEGDY